jgi:hypothetical protein
LAEEEARLKEERAQAGRWMDGWMDGWMWVCVDGWMWGCRERGRERVEVIHVDVSGCDPTRDPK